LISQASRPGIPATEIAGDTKCAVKRARGNAAAARSMPAGIVPCSAIRHVDIGRRVKGAGFSAVGHSVRGQNDTVPVLVYAG